MPLWPQYLGANPLLPTTEHRSGSRKECPWTVLVISHLLFQAWSPPDYFLSIAVVSFICFSCGFFQLDFFITLMLFFIFLETNFSDMLMVLFCFLTR